MGISSSPLRIVSILSGVAVAGGALAACSNQEEVDDPPKKEIEGPKPPDIRPPAPEPFPEDPADVTLRNLVGQDTATLGQALLRYDDKDGDGVISLIDGEHNSGLMTYRWESINRYSNDDGIVTASEIETHLPDRLVHVSEDYYRKIGHGPYTYTDAVDIYQDWFDR